MNTSDKFALIYEFNNDSPLFARVAAKHFDEGDTEEAISILEAGLEKYPNYPTAYLIYAIALATNGRRGEALKAIRKASDIFDEPETINYYIDRIDRMPKNLSFFEETKEVEEEPEEPTEPDSTEPEQPSQTDEEDLEKLAELLKKAPAIKESKDDEIEVSEPETEEEAKDEGFLGKSLVSETLAKIYFNQGNYREALSIYETLLDIHPQRKEYYEQKIQQIKTQMNDNE